MKPIKLIISGLNSYIEPQEIDFNELTSRGLFGIFGPTGSGKSTILDAITLALYGEISRISRNEKKQFINTNVGTTSVRFKFEIGKGNKRKKYEIVRSMKINNKGEFKTTLARLIEINEDDTENILCDKPNEVTKEVINLIGLELNDFTRSVVLPQGKFNEFLKLSGTDRRNMLERLFNLEKFGKSLMDKVKIKRNIERGSIRELEAKISQYDGINEEELKKLKDKYENLKIEEKDLRNQKKEIENKFNEANEIIEIIKELDNYKIKIKELEKEKSNIENKREIIKRANDVYFVEPIVDKYLKTKQLLDDNNKDLIIQNKILKDNKEAFNELENKYKAYVELKDKKLPILIERKSNLLRAIELSKNIEKIESEIKNIELNLKNKNNKYELLKINIKNKSEEINIFENDIIKKQNIINELKIIPEYRNKLNKANEIGIELNSINKDKKNTLLKISNLEKEIENKTKVLIEFKNKDKDLKEKIEILDNELKNLIKDCPGDNDSLINKNNEINIFNENYNKLKEKLNKKKELNVEVLKINKEKDEIVTKKDKLQDLIDYITKNIEKLELEYEEYKINNYANLLRNKLKENEPCLVCGSVHHNITKVEKNIEINKDINNEIKKLKIELEENKVELNSLNSKIASLESKLDLLNSELEKLKDIDINLDFSIYDKKKKSLENEYILLKDNIDKYNKLKEEKENLLKEIKDKKHRNEIELNKIQEIINQNERLLKEEKSKLISIESAFNQKKENLNKYKKELKVDSVQQKIKEINENDILIDKLTKEIEILKNNKDKESKVINDLNEKTDKIRIEISKLESNKENKELNIKTLLEEFNKLTEEKELNDYFKKTCEEIDKININYNKLKIESENKRKEINEIENKLNILTSDNIRLNKEIILDKEKLDNYLIEYNFKSIEEVKKLKKPKEEIKDLENEVNKYDEEFNKISSLIDEKLKKLNNRSVNEEEYNELKTLRNKITESIDKKVEEIGATKKSISDIEDKLIIVNKLKDEYKKVSERLELLEQLDKTLEGNKFVEYVAINQLKYVAKEASKRLKDITKGRYALEIDSNGNFIMRDDFNGGNRRSTNTLSGGETFLTSLSLALALSSQIQLKGNAPLEFFFLDEGFGTLDLNLLEIVMSSLEKLHNDKLSVGIISHVEELKERVPVKLIVKPSEPGGIGSRVKIEYS